MSLSSRFALVFATAGYIGRVPLAPGTFGSAAGLVVFRLMLFLPPAAWVILLLLFTAGAVWAAHQAESILQAKDPSQVVVDEAVGMMASLAGLPVSVPVWAAGFLFFRAFDIIKPFPIRYIEKRLPGGAGIVADDAAAGIAANIVLRVLLCFDVPVLA